MAVNDVRFATHDDLDALCRLGAIVQRLHAELEPAHFKGDLDLAAVRAFFADRFTPPNGLILVERSGVAAGYAWYEMQDGWDTPFSAARRRLYLHHICADPSYRRHGVATAMLSFIEHAARTAGVRHLGLNMWTANETAHRFFTAQGFASYNCTMGKTVRLHETESGAS